MDDEHIHPSSVTQFKSTGNRHLDLTMHPRIETLASMYEANGIIKIIFPEQSFPSGFTKREFVITTSAERYPQDIKFECVKEKCAELNPFTEGDEVTVQFDIRGNEYNGKYYVNLSAWKIQAGRQSPRSEATNNSKTSPMREPSVSELRNEADFDDADIAPF